MNQQKSGGLPNWSIRFVTVFATIVLVFFSLPLSAQGSYIRTSKYAFPATSYPYAVVVAANGDYVVGSIATSHEACTLSRISGGTSTPIYTYSGYWPQIYDVKIQADGQFIVVEFGSPSGAVAKISPAGARSIVYTTEPGKAPLAVAIDTDGNYIVHIADFAGTYQALVKINQNGAVVRTFPLPSESRGNGRVEIGKDGNYIIAQAGDSTGSSFARLLSVNRESGAVTTLYDFTRNAYPFDTAIDSQGNIFVVEVTNNILSKITPAGQREVIFQFAAGTNPNCVDIDSSGNFVVSEGGTKAISVISRAQTTAPPTTTSTPPVTTTTLPSATTTTSPPPTTMPVVTSHPVVTTPHETSSEGSGGMILPIGIGSLIVIGGLIFVLRAMKK